MLRFHKNNLFAFKMSLEQNHDLRDSFASALKMTASFHPLVLSLACKKITGRRWCKCMLGGG